MIRNLLLTAGLIFIVGTAVAQAGHPWGHHHTYSYHSYRPLATHAQVRTVAYRPVFAAPTTVVVQRPVYVAYPVTIPQPVFVETPVVQSHVVPSHQMIPVPQPYPHRVTKVRYRAPLWPLGHRDKLRYRIDTPYGTHKYTYRTSWWNGTTKFEYDFDD